MTYLISGYLLVRGKGEKDNNGGSYVPPKSYPPLTSPVSQSYLAGPAAGEIEVSAVL
jgi:hypothetical protein